MSIYVRAMLDTDMDRVQQIEETSYRWTWSREDFATVRACNRVFGLVAQYPSHHFGPIGFSLHRVQSDHVELLNVAVHKAWRRRGVATAIVNRLKATLYLPGRRCITADVAERNLDAQLFFRDGPGFRVIAIQEEVCPYSGPFQTYRFCFSARKEADQTSHALSTRGKTDAQ